MEAAVMASKPQLAPLSTRELVEETTVMETPAEPNKAKAEQVPAEPSSEDATPTAPTNTEPKETNDMETDEEAQDECTAMEDAGKSATSPPPLIAVKQEPAAVTVIKQEPAAAAAVPAEQYMLPTYGVPYPDNYTPVPVQNGSGQKLFRPVQFYSTGESEEEDTETTVTRSGSHVSVDSAYSSQSDVAKIEVKLHKKNLWKGFMSIGNEMIVTKPGRSLFPTLLISISGLHPRKDYTLAVRVAPVDNLRYKYLNMKWCPVGESDVIQNEEKQVFYHPNSPKMGQVWMRKPISFKSIKITNNAKSKNGNVLLHTMNKYMLKVVIIPTDKTMPTTTVALPLTTFIAVSAYQSMAVTQMKIDNNPFAKAFKYQDSKTTICVPKAPLQVMPPALALSNSSASAANKVVAAALQAQAKLRALPAIQPRPHPVPIIVPSPKQSVRLPPLVSHTPRPQSNNNLRPPPLSLRYPPPFTPPAPPRAKGRTTTTTTITTAHTINKGPILVPTTPLTLSAVPLIRGQSLGLPHYYPILPSFFNGVVPSQLASSGVVRPQLAQLVPPQLVQVPVTPSTAGVVTQLVPPQLVQVPVAPTTVTTVKIEKPNTPEPENCSDSEEAEITVT